MIPSRTVFNHRKWIYIELAITRAHSGHGPLVYQPPSAYQSRASSNVFPISSLGASKPPPSLLSLPSQRGSFRSKRYCLFRRCFLIFPTSSRSFIFYFSRRIYFSLSFRFSFCRYHRSVFFVDKRHLR